MYSSVPLLLPDDAPKLQPVVQKSSSPGLVQPEAPVERPEANTPETEPTPPASEPELPLPASLSTPVNLPLTAANSSERPSARESASSHLSSVGEQKPSLAPPQPPNTDKPLLDSPRTLAALSVAAPKALNGLAESGTELETAAHEPSLMPPAALQPQASSPAYREASSETLPSDMRPQVPIAAALAPMAPVAVVPVTLSSSPAPALPVMLPPGLPPLVQATTEADELSKSIDTKDLVPRAGTEAQGGITDSKTESQHQALIRNSPTTGTLVCCISGTIKLTRNSVTNKCILLFGIFLGDRAVGMGDNFMSLLFARHKQTLCSEQMVCLLVVKRLHQVVSDWKYLGSQQEVW